MSKKISVSEFISDKKLKKIEKIIESSSSVEDAYDKIENLLVDDFKVKDLGTNRIIFTNKKFKKYICKIAGDSHGIEANYREFYNGDLDEKRITKSYSISENGVFLVQEKVTPFNSKMMKKHKKEVRHMLKGLENKLLLVDCKLSNFKNFGMRDNNQVVLLDHGDTIPLTMYDGGKIVNMTEEANVSLRCKEFKRGTSTSKNPKPCDGKLEYTKDYDYFVCKKCGAKVPIHNAYKEFYADVHSNNVVPKNMLLDLNDDFDPDEYAKKIQETIKEYAKDTMKYNKKENKDMKKQINGNECVQIKGYWLPINSKKSFAAAKLMAVKRGDLTPYDYLKFLGENPDNYKMTKDDHVKSREEKKENTETYEKIAKVIYDYAKSVNIPGSDNIIAFENKEIGKRTRDGYYIKVSFDEANKLTGNKYDIPDMVYSINKEIAMKNDVSSVFFIKNDAFYIKFNNTDSLYDRSDEQYVGVDDEELYYKMVDSDESNNESTEVSNDEPVKAVGKVSVPFSDICKIGTEKVDDIECVRWEGFFIPLDILNKYYDAKDASFNLPDPIEILSEAGYDPDEYVIAESDEEESIDIAMIEADESVNKNDRIYNDTEIDFSNEYDYSVVEDDDDSDEDDYDSDDEDEYSLGIIVSGVVSREILLDVLVSSSKSHDLHPTYGDIDKDSIKKILINHDIIDTDDDSLYYRIFDDIGCVDVSYMTVSNKYRIDFRRFDINGVLIYLVDELSSGTDLSNSMLLAKISYILEHINFIDGYSCDSFAIISFASWLDYNESFDDVDISFNDILPEVLSNDHDNIKDIMNEYAEKYVRRFIEYYDASHKFKKLVDDIFEEGYDVRVDDPRFPFIDRMQEADWSIDFLRKFIDDHENIENDNSEEEPVKLVGYTLEDKVTDAINSLITGLDVITLDINAIKDKTFKINIIEDKDTNKIVSINLYNIIMHNLND